MVRATHADKNLVVEILTRSFADNKSVNYVVKQDKHRNKRFRQLMKYSFEICTLFGEVFLSNDRKACALLVMPDKKKMSFKSILLDIQLVWMVIGLSGISKAMAREKIIDHLHPQGHIYYLWFVGVDPDEQQKGIGTKLLTELVELAEDRGRPIYLETSVTRNIPWYKRMGFMLYEKLDFGYDLYCLKRE